MNSVGFLADSNKLKISEPSMSFSPEDCLVWVNKEMKSQAQRQVHKQAHTHPQLVRQNCRQRREGGGRKASTIQTLKRKRMGNKIAN